MSLCTVTGGVTSEGIPVRTLLILVALCTANACYLPYDVCHHVSIAPSARSLAASIFMAVDRLNALIGEPRFWATEAPDGDRLDGAVVIRGVDRLGCEPGAANCADIARTYRTMRGIVIGLTDDVNVQVIAHELGHAAGLYHSDGPNNLMYPYAAAGGWELTDEQLDVLR